MEVKGSDLQREITHFGYKYKNKIKLGSEKDGWLPKVIDEPFDPINEGYFNYANDEFITLKQGEKELSFRVFKGTEVSYNLSEHIDFN